MINNEMQIIIDKTMKVCLSCTTEVELKVAIAYRDLAYRMVMPKLNLQERVNVVIVVERSIGFAQCNIK